MIARNVVVVGVLAAVLAPAGQFKCGALRTSEDVVSLSIPHPPDALLKAKNLRVLWESAGSFQKADQVRQLIEHALSKEFGFTDPNPDATVKLTLLTFEPPTERRYTQNESRSIKVGEKPTYDKNGKQTGTQDIFENRVVPIEYWEASGSLKLNATVTDKSGSAIDGFAPVGAYRNKLEIAVNGESKLGATFLPTAPGIETMMMEQVSGHMRRRYTATFDPVRVILACDSELRPANKLAQASQWKDALAGWKAATLKKNAADQIFNIAVATEALAYAEYARTQALDDMLPMFKQAMASYEQALSADPQEKYMRQQRDRLRTAQANIENVRKQYELQQAEAKKAEEAALKIIEAKAAEQRHQEELRHAVDDQSPDSPDEAKFRSLARARISAMDGEVTEKQWGEVLAFGQRTYGLNDVKSYRVVGQEVARKKSLGQSLKDYDDTFKAFVADGKLTADERTQLKDLQSHMKLEDSDVQSVESKYTFKDLTKSVPAPAVATPRSAPKPPAKKPVVPVKPPTPATPAAAPASPGTPAVTPAKPGIGSNATKKDTGAKKQDQKKQDDKKQDDKKPIN